MSLCSIINKKRGELESEVRSSAKVELSPLKIEEGLDDPSKMSSPWLPGSEKFIKLENGERSSPSKRKMDEGTDFYMAGKKVRKLDDGEKSHNVTKNLVLKKEIKEESEIDVKNEDSWYNSRTCHEKQNNDLMSDKGDYFHGKIIKIINENYGIFGGFNQTISTSDGTNIELFLFDVCDVLIGQKSCKDLGKSLKDVMEVGENARIHGLFIDYADAKNREGWKVERLATALTTASNNQMASFPKTASRREISRQKIENFNDIQKFLIGVNMTQEEKNLLESLKIEIQLPAKHQKQPSHSAKGEWDEKASHKGEWDKQASHKCKGEWDDQFERDLLVLARREKQLDYGKNTSDYDTYLKHVPREARTSRMPRTPDRFKKYSRRQWDGMVKAWKLNIHTAAEIVNSGHSYLDVHQETERLGN